MPDTGPALFVIDAHPVIAASLGIALGSSGFAPVTSIDPDRLDLGARAVAPGQGDLVLLGLLYGDGRTALPLIAPLVARGCRVVVMTADQGLPLAGACLRQGAEAVLSSAMSFDRLLAALDRLAQGSPAMTESERTALLENLDRYEATERALHEPFDALTAREAEVLAALVAGQSPKLIARTAAISVSTVRGHIQRVLSKLDVSSQREALAIARHAGWPAPEPLLPSTSPKGGSCRPGQL